MKQLQSKFPPEFSTPVDLKKVKIEVMKPWITDRVTELLGMA
jgi:serine/arginine repetitive matrix protein 1